MIEGAHVYVTAEKVYVPIVAKTESGWFWQTGPVLTVEPALEGLIGILEEAVCVGTARVKQPTREELRRPQPIYKAIGIRSSRKVAQAGVVRACVWWYKDKVLVVLSGRGTNDADVDDSGLQVQLAPDASVREMAETILREVEARGGAGSPARVR